MSIGLSIIISVVEFFKKFFFTFQRSRTISVHCKLSLWRINFYREYW